MTEGPRVNFVMREALFEIYNGYSVLHTSMRNKQVEFNPYIYTLYQHCPVLAMKYLFLNTQQGGIQNSRRSSLLIRHACRLFEKWMSKFFLCLLEQKTLEAKNIY